jgi:hypothetical protein
MNNDQVHHPHHYTAHKSGIECIEITEHLSFCLGNALKYLWRSGLKDGTPGSADLQKAAWYLRREVDSHNRRHIAHSLSPQVAKLATQVASCEDGSTPLAEMASLLAGPYGWVVDEDLLALADRIDPPEVTP